MKLCRWLSALAVLIGALLLASWSAILTATDHAATRITPNSRPRRIAPGPSIS